LRKEGEGLAARTAITLTGADAAMVIPGGRRPPITGRIGLQLELDGTGLSPRALIGSLGGTGSVSLEGAQFAGLDPKAFAAATKMADQGLAVDLAKARDIVAPALASGNLTVAHAETAVTVAAGEARLSTIVARGEGADITVNGGFDLTQGTIDARILLSGPKALSATLGRPEIAVALKGPYSAPIISHDVSALVSWLALHSVDQQSKKLRDIEAERRRPGRTDAPSTAPALPPPIEISPAPGRKTQSRSDNAPIQAGQPRAAAESSQPVDVAR
jgi:large subunit ribosomal protein L24